MLPKMLNSSILHWSDGLSIAWRPNVTVPDKKAALSSLKGLEPRVTKWHHNQASGKLSNCKWGGKKNTQTIFSDNLLIDNSFQILNCFTNGVYIKARRCTMNGSIIVLGKTTFTYSLIFCEEKLDTFLTIGNSWLSDKINCCPWYPQFTAITVKCWHVFWGWDLNNISPNRQCFQIRFFPGNNVFNHSPSNPTIEQADTTEGKHLLVEKTSYYAFSSTSAFLTYTFCPISISRHCSKLVNDLAKKWTNVTLVKSKLRVPKI